jgi:hypothetical protein
LQDRPFHTKRPHKKSRSGCKNCKVRKVKCDEARPICRSCRLRKTDCVYLSSSPVSAPVPTFSEVVLPNLPLQHQPQSSPPGLSLVLSPPDSSLDYPPLLYGFGDQGRVYDEVDEDEGVVIAMEPTYRHTGVDEMDMKLMWFFTSFTSASFSVAGEFGRPAEIVMRSTLVQLAFENRFLMDSVLALASLHMRCNNQAVNPGRASFYRARAIESYRRAFAEARPETYPALLSNALLLTALASETFRDPESQELYIIDWITVWRGIGLMVGLTTVPRMYQVGINTLFYRPDMDLEGAAVAIPNDLLFMITSVPMDDPDYWNTQTHYEALKYLGTLYQGLKLGLGPLSHMAVITWFTFLPEPFVELVRQRNPRALIIIGHYACFLKMLQSLWWVEGIGQRSLQDICKYLGPDWHQHMKVLLQAIDTDDLLELGRLLSNDPSWSPKQTEQSSEFPAKRAPQTLAWVDQRGTIVDPKMSIMVKSGEYTPEKTREMSCANAFKRQV